MCDKAAAMGPASKTTPIIKSQSADFHFGEILPLCVSPDSGVIQHGLLSVCTHFCRLSNAWCIHRDTCKCSVLKKSLPLEEGAGTFFAFRASNHCSRSNIWPYMGVCRCVSAQCFVAHVWTLSFRNLLDWLHSVCCCKRPYHMPP